MTKKSDLVARLLDRIELPHGVPAPRAETRLLELGMVLALLPHVSQSRAEGFVEALGKAYEDWNEARVAQAQELARQMAGRGAREADKVAKLLPAAASVKAYLQEVFQKTHGLDLEFLREDPASAARLVTAMPMLGNYLGSVLLWQAEGEQPVTTAVVRVLDRLRLLTRTSSVKKARAAIEPLVPSDEKIRFAAAFGYVADQWCDPRKPICWECPLVEDCATGKKVFKDWKTQQERLAAQRKREEAKRLAAEKREAARMAREAERERKREEAARAKAERERERQAKRAEAAAKKAATKKSSGAGKGGAKAAGSKKAAPKKTAGKKAPAKKGTTARKTGSKAKASPRKTASRKPATTKKKSAAKKKTATRAKTASKSRPRRR
jgi:endonuclease III